MISHTLPRKPPAESALRSEKRNSEFSIEDADIDLPSCLLFHVQCDTRGYDCVGSLRPCERHNNADMRPLQNFVSVPSYVWNAGSHTSPNLTKTRCSRLTARVNHQVNILTLDLQ